MPENKLKEEKLEEREYKGIVYTVNKNEKELVYRTEFGDERDTVLTGTSKRSLTIQMKKEIDMRLKVGNKPQPESEPVEDSNIQDSLEDMSEKELEELFDPDTYKDEDDEPEIIEVDKTDPKVVGKGMARKTVGEQVEEFEEKGNDEGAFDIIEGDPTFENEEENGVFGVSGKPLTPEDITEEEEAERLEAEAGGAFEDEELTEQDKELVKALETRQEEVFEKTTEKTDADIQVRVNIQQFPNSKQEGELKFVVVDGKLYGQISNQTFVTIERNRFKLIPPTTFTNMRKGRTIRVIPLDLMHIPDDYDFELTFRFLVVNNQHEIGKSGGRMCVKVRNQDTDLRIDQGCIFDPFRFTALNVPRKVKFVDFDKLIPSGPMKYPMGQFEEVSSQIMFLDEDHRYEKELFELAQKVFEFKNTKTMIDSNRKILILMTTDEKMGILQAALGENEDEEEPEEEIDEIEDEIDEMFEEE